ncbi:MAG TPA: hypothetical protein VGH34_19020 [Vicinamibacterales bacterium]
MRVTIGATALVLRVTSSDGGFTARAERETNGDPFGIEVTAATESEAIERLSAWLEWQSEHAAALEALQAAERNYHRTIAGSAFGDSNDESVAALARRESLSSVDEARVKLDRVRRQRHGAPGDAE